MEALGRRERRTEPRVAIRTNATAIRASATTTTTQKALLLLVNLISCHVLGLEMPDFLLPETIPPTIRRVKIMGSEATLTWTLDTFTGG
jgi:hypothetical protein